MTTELPLVSIIIITYNSSKYVLETLESAKAQTYKNVELIISDDGSQDNTVEICQKFIIENEERFFKTKLITVQKNTGIPGNLNRGIKICCGTFVKVIAGDDILASDCIQQNIDFIGDAPDRYIIISEMQAFLDGTRPKKILEIKKPFGNVFSGQFSSKEQNRFLIHTSFFGNAPTLFYKKELFEKVTFDETIPLLEDYPFAINATQRGFKYHYLPRVTVMYRVREDSTYFKNNKEIFGSFYKAKYDFDRKYRFPYLNNLALGNERYYYQIQKYFDEKGLNKNTKMMRSLYRIANLANPYRYLLFLKNKFSKN